MVARSSSPIPNDGAIDTGGTAELEAARALAPVIMARARECEAARRLPSDLALKLAEAGLFRIVVPKIFGGSELHLIDIVRVIEEVSRADGSIGWCHMIGSTTAILAGLLPEPSAREIYGTDANVITGGAIAPTGRCVPENGGYRVSGRWQWGSGSQNCQWLTGGSLVFEDGKPRMIMENVPEIRLTFFPAKDVEILDTWDSSGLRGTGSHDFQVKEVFVPEDRSIIMGVTQPVLKRPLYHFPVLGMFSVAVCSVSLGIARRAIDEFVAMAPKKTPTWERRSVAESPRVQAQVAEAEAMVRSARAFLFEAIDAAWMFSEVGENVPIEQHRDLRLAAGNVAWQCARAVDLMYNAGGGSSVHASSPLQRCFRDAHTVTQHVLVNSNVFESAGRLHLMPEAQPPPLF
jgi:alkylation response protein AidB-like acyl-CoA dehydrogenase